MSARRDPVAWALAIQAEWERAESEDDAFRLENVHRTPRCGECRLGLGEHELADPLCEARPLLPTETGGDRG